MELVKFAVGEKFPTPFRPYDGATLHLAGDTFGVVISMVDISSAEVKVFRKVKMRIGVAVIQGVPFVLLDFPGMATFDASLNLLLESQESRDAFLAGEPKANLVSLFLVDHRTGILKGMRSLGCPVEMMTEIKTAAFDQAAAFASGAKVEAKIQEVMSLYTTERLMAMAKMHVFKGGEGRV